MGLAIVLLMRSLSDSKPDIIFLVLDTQRADRLGCYGHTPASTPNLDAFAGRGALFEQGIAPAQWTIPSHASMFTGLYPTAHQVTQSNQALGADLPHIVDMVHSAGYETVGFCNNPLVGVLNNGLKRGFDTFYNYGGAVPSVPGHSSSLPGPLGALSEKYTQFLRRISYPIQNFFGQSDLAFRLSLKTWFTPLWSRMANFKGQNARSVRDIVHFLGQREREERDRPLFLFINLMETHLPFWPPGEFVDRQAPYFRRSKEARATMQRWNREAYRWAVPLPEPLSELEERVLCDMYDAEVAYQDDYLGSLFSMLAERANPDNTLTVIVGDHGDGLGEHDHMGHSFVAYHELVHVPLILHWPERIEAGRRVYAPASTRRVFHTILDAAGGLPEPVAGMEAAEAQRLTLLADVRGEKPEDDRAMVEVYPPLNLVKAIERREPAQLARFRPQLVRRALVKDGRKVVEVDGSCAEYYLLDRDPLEQHDVMAELPGEANSMYQELRQLISQVERQRELRAPNAVIDLEADKHLLQRLRGLGYIE